MPPFEEYTRRLEERGVRSRELDSLHYRLGNLRLLAFGVILLALLLVIAQTLPNGVWFFVPVAVFAALMAWHRRVTVRWEHARRAVQFYQDGLARLAGKWMKRGVAGSEYLDPQHPYARDLDLFGNGSLFELLCRARTRPGADRLAQWLLAGASPDDIAARRQAVAELVPRLDLREELTALNAGRSSLSAPHIIAWAEAPARLQSGAGRLLAGLLGLAGVGSLAYWVVSWNPTPLIAALLLIQGFARWAEPELHESVAQAEPMRADARSLASFLERLEKETFTSPLLQRWSQPWPSQALAELQTLLDHLEARRNIFLAPFLHVALAKYQVAALIERWRARHGAQMRVWIEALADYEALSSFASFAYENPTYVWAELLPAGSGLAAVELGHPLLGPECVGNDVELSGAALWIVSGSNMAGKSSLLRALGSNVVLAMAGAPVRARSLRLEPLRPGASIQLADSLLGGLSRFYAEILRLRQLLELAGEKPRLLFLLDEIMAGTNSHDRRIGAEAVIRGLLEHGAVGLVTTHDLALTEILKDRAVNVHFEDQLVEGKMSFDYRLRPGPVTRSNALELMRAVGLEV
jgi:hypothetical protein